MVTCHHFIIYTYEKKYEVIGDKSVALGVVLFKNVYAIGAS